MENINIKELIKDEAVEIYGGEEDSNESSFGGDVGFLLGYILSAILKGASAIKG